MVEETRIVEEAENNTSTTMLLDPKSPKLRDLKVSDMVWIVEQGMVKYAEPALVLRGLPTRSITPQVDLVTILDSPLSHIIPYYELAEKQKRDRGTSVDVENGVEFRFKYPVDGVSKVTIRVPTVRDLADVKSQGHNLALVTGDVAMISHLTDIPMATLHRMRIGDFSLMQDSLMDFLMG